MSTSTRPEWTLERFILPSGECPVDTFIDGLVDERHRADAGALRRLLATWGNALRPPQSKALGDIAPGLFEARGHQVRLFYVFRPGRRIILLDGIVKKQDEIPKATQKLLRQYVRLLEQAEEGEERS